MKTDFATAVPLLRRAISLDPNFAVAYNALAVNYMNLGESILATENGHKAYELRGRVTARERFQIESSYYYVVFGDMQNALQSCELWAQTYPRDDAPRGMRNWESIPLSGNMTKPLSQRVRAFGSHRRRLV